MLWFTFNRFAESMSTLNPVINHPLYSYRLKLIDLDPKNPLETPRYMKKEMDILKWALEREADNSRDPPLRQCCV